jgi:hypothetical protein
MGDVNFISLLQRWWLGIFLQNISFPTLSTPETKVRIESFTVVNKRRQGRRIQHAREKLIHTPTWILFDYFREFKVSITHTRQNWIEFLH